MSDDSDPATPPHEVSIVVPVYKGESSLPSLLREIDPLTELTRSPAGALWRVREVLLVFDNGPDGSAATIRRMAAEHPYVRPVWLSRNYGQHSATLAGMASSGGEWIATVDEDGQHDPRDIGVLLDAALAESSPLVYAAPSNPAPHGPLRNAASRAAKAIVAGLAGDPRVLEFQSFRLILGEIGRSVAAYSGPDVYLDVALSWVAARSTSAPVALRAESGRTSGYSGRRLLSHFWRLILSSGTRALRVVSAMGALLAVIGTIFAIVVAVQRIIAWSLPEGWTSLMVVLLISSGAILFALGVIAEFLGVAVKTALGKPSYLIVSDPERGPLGRRTPSA
jgi:glycosyltransferase involved in cell wall biosynthesis